jgi:phage recombination protein Bet
MTQPLQHPSIIAALAEQYGMDRRAFELVIRRTCLPDPEASMEDVVAFLMVAKRYGLNPLTREVYAFRRKEGGIQAIVGIDGWFTLANREEQFDGITFADLADEQGRLVAITARVHRKDRTHPIEVTEYMAECKRGTSQWSQWPSRMLRHKAAIQALRYAFGFSGIVDEDEAARLVQTEERARVLTEASGGMNKLRAALASPEEPAINIPAVMQERAAELVPAASPAADAVVEDVPQ